MQQGIMGDFFLAIDEKKTLVCPVTTVETSTARNKKHAMVMYHFDDENFIFNTSNPFQAMEFKVSIIDRISESNKGSFRFERVNHQFDF